MVGCVTGTGRLERLEYDGGSVGVDPRSCISYAGADDVWYCSSLGIGLVVEEVGFHVLVLLCEVAMIAW